MAKKKYYICEYFEEDICDGCSHGKVHRKNIACSGTKWCYTAQKEIGPCMRIGEDFDEE